MIHGFLVDWFVGSFLVLGRMICVVYITSYSISLRLCLYPRGILLYESKFSLAWNRFPRAYGPIVHVPVLVP